MDNEIPHLSPSDGNITKRYYRNLNNRRSLTEAEREMFDCSELLCGKFKKNFVMVMMIVITNIT